MKSFMLLFGVSCSIVLMVSFMPLIQQTRQEDSYRISIIKGNAKDSKIQKIIRLADALKALLKEEQLSQLQLDYSKKDAAKWSNFPASFRNARRVGLNFGSMTPEQIEAAKALIKEVAGTAVNEGWDELQQIINADHYLKAHGGGYDYGAANYYIALLGKPATTGLFEIQFGGHHMAFANTYKDGMLVSGTPSFRGVEPSGTFELDGKSNQPLNQEQAALSAMLSSLSEQEQATAKLGSTYGDIIVGPQRDGAFPATASGIRCSSLTPAQKKLVLGAINTYVDDIDDADAKVFMKKYSQELDSTYLAFSGTITVAAINDYVRIDGPSVWIEFSCQRGVIMRGMHPHSVWRDKTKDYGGN